MLCRLAVDARQAALDQARAQLKSMQLQQQGALELARKGFRSQTQVLTSQASLDAANAAARQAEIARPRSISAHPSRASSIIATPRWGRTSRPARPCGVLIELDPLLIVGDVPETEAAKLRVGAPASARLVSGQRIEGRIRYVAHDADPQTRTYHLEIAVPNPRLDIRSGLSAEVRVSTGSGPAHLLPVSAMVLDTAGRQGVRYVLDDGRVAFAPVTIVEETHDGVWVTGLSGPVKLITVGQSFVADGQKVRVALAR